MEADACFQELQNYISVEVLLWKLSNSRKLSSNTSEEAFVKALVEAFVEAFAEASVEVTSTASSTISIEASVGAFVEATSMEGMTKDSVEESWMVFHINALTEASTKV